ncbi:hypothetical protein [Clostridium chrysemydis]|nr:hypothetical protein [Clostridium chrysemydis]
MSNGICIDNNGCNRADVCMKVFGNNFRPYEHSVEELYERIIKG